MKKYISMRITNLRSFAICMLFSPDASQRYRFEFMNSFTMINASDRRQPQLTQSKITIRAFRWRRCSPFGVDCCLLTRVHCPKTRRNGKRNFATCSCRSISLLLFHVQLTDVFFGNKNINKIICFAREEYDGGISVMA